MRIKSLWNTIKTFIDTTKINIVVLFIACKSKEVPFFAKLVAGIVVAYALSPIDLIPDFIPVLGYLDDALILPLGIMLAIKLIPVNIMSACRAEALLVDYKTLPKSKVAAALIILLWIALLSGVIGVVVQVIKL